MPRYAYLSLGLKLILVPIPLQGSSTGHVLLPLISGTYCRRGSEQGPRKRKDGWRGWGPSASLWVWLPLTH